MNYTIEFVVLSVVVILLLLWIIALLDSIHREALYHNSFIRGHLNSIYDKVTKIENLEADLERRLDKHG